MTTTQPAYFIKAAKRIGCSDVNNLERCLQHANRMVENASYLSDACTMALMTVLDHCQK